MNRPISMILASLLAMGCNFWCKIVPILKIRYTLDMVLGELKLVDKKIFDGLPQINKSCRFAGS